MSRPSPLSAVSGRYDPSDYQQLTPRTPRSRAGRNQQEDTFAEIELHDFEGEYDDDRPGATRQQQSMPLLASSMTAGFPRTARTARGIDPHEDDLNGHIAKAFNDWASGLTVPMVLSRVPVIVGTMVAGFLLFLIVVSFRSPGTLERYVGDGRYGLNGKNSSVSRPGAHPELIISYKGFKKFPLSPTQFQEQCSTMMSQGKMLKEKYWEIPAEGIEDVIHDDEVNPPHSAPICKSTITYMLSGEVGLLADLALMAQVAALARERNRTFFVDDTYWDRGRWSDYFEDVTKMQPGPEPGCKRPPAKELVACPRHARHWVVTSTTATFHLGHSYMTHYDNGYGHNLHRMRTIFDFAAESLRSTIRPNSELNSLIHDARTELLLKLSMEQSTSSKPRYIGVHVRRGDKKATSWQYHNSYVPITNYPIAVEETWSRLATGNSPPNAVVHFASDDPKQLQLYKDASGKDIVYSLFESHNPTLKSIASQKEYSQPEFENFLEAKRITATKGMIVDFALLTGAWAVKEDIIPDAVVCTISSAVCKLAAPALGWERAFGNMNKMGRMDKQTKRWVEIDQKGSIVPAWLAFDL